MGSDTSSNTQAAQSHGRCVQCLPQVKSIMITFKNVEDKDQHFIEKVFRSTREEELNLMNWSEDQKQSFSIMQSIAQLHDYKKNYKGAEHKIILYKKKPVGRIYLWESNAEIRIIDISLLTEFRNRGIGRTVITDIIKLAILKNKNVTLAVGYRNPAKRLYEKLGFKKKSTTDTHEQMVYRVT